MPGTRSASTAKRDVVLVVVLVLVATGLITYFAAKPSGDSTATEQSQSRTEGTQAGPLDTLARRAEGDPMAVGRADAPVTMVMYSDYRCPFCAKFSRDTEPELLQRYVEPGVLRIEWRDLPIFGEESLVAARAGRAAAEQGKFWEFNRTLYAASPTNGHPDLTREALRGFAREAGVADLDRFTAALSQTRFDAAIKADIDEATALGVSSTPTFVINGKPVLGAQPLEAFTSAIDEAAAAKS
ncbi:protein-disulfide isomerase [Saccharomonospora amisosensis]|uniref:Protein-disulfide isomerase n=1 Tax=Saccharomonospora amisosensis TaxID=1128677 RepID=A0A7X5ULF7_9PSEU|nr:thioredoxin domain-containing protein [Saccharomonospora amisosensis]NIJ10176.1 protein-disulfide isomerase [Saccharomonospora amisosensis]